MNGTSSDTLATITTTEDLSQGAFIPFIINAAAAGDALTIYLMDGTVLWSRLLTDFTPELVYSAVIPSQQATDGAPQTLVFNLEGTGTGTSSVSFPTSWDVLNLVPGRGKADTDCIAEWIVDNANNSPALDSSGIANSQQVCMDGDSSCDADGEVNGSCTYRVGVCVNSPDEQVPSCTPTDVETVALKKPRPDSPKATDASNALSLRTVLTTVSISAVNGKHDEAVVYSPAIATQTTCSDLASIAVPTGTGKPGKKTIKLQSLTSVPSGATKGTKDVDSLALICLPAS